MADSVLDRKSSQRRLGKESIGSSSSNKTTTTTTTDKFKQEHNNNTKSSDSQNQSKPTKSTTSLPEETTSNNNSNNNSYNKRETNSRSAKSKALVAISSLLLPTTTNATTIATRNTSRASSTSSTSTNNKRRRRLSSSSTSSILNNNHQINNSKIDSSLTTTNNNNNNTTASSGVGAASSAASRLNLRSSSKNSNETVFTVNSDITNQTLASTSTSRYQHNTSTTSSKSKTSSKSSSGSKAVPTKRAKLNSDILDCSTDSSSSVSPVSYSRASLATSTTTTSSNNRSQNTKQPTTTNTNKNKELGNTCNTRSKETGSCVSRSSLRRGRQQHSAEAITSNSTGTVVATTSTGIVGSTSASSTQPSINSKRQRTNNNSNNNKSSSKSSTATTTTTKRGATLTGSSLLINLNKNMSQQQSNQNQNDNSSGLTTTTTTTTAASTVPTNTPSVTNSTTHNTLTFSSLFGSRTHPSSTISSSFNVSNAAVGSGSNSGSAAAATAGTSASAATYSFPISESESDDNNADFSRLTDILQARGLPSHIVNAFGTKVQQFLNRTISTGIPSRSQQLIQTLQQNDESLKLTALSELCQLLVMGNEDTLVGFPIKQAVPLLLQCLNSESNNYDLMNHACRALTYMMESLPRSSSAIAEGIPIFLEKLQIIQCMDVAEQALTALEILSRRNSKQILHSNGIAACLTFIDFFSITAQRNALQITANCCQNMIKEEFVHIQSSLMILAQRLTHSDKKSVESVCIIFSRLVETFQHDLVILKEIASHNVLTNMQQILVIQPQIISSSIFVLVLHIMYLMCVNCTELAVDLLQNNIADTLKYLLVGSSSSSSSNQTTTTTTPTSSSTTTTVANNKTKSLTGSDVKESQQNNFELVNRPPQELYEIVSLIGEIMPKLPQIGIFSIDDALKKSSSQHQTEQVTWQWKDEREIWRPYTAIDSRIIEASYIQEENEVNLSTMGRTYIIDFNSMLQINEETGTARPVFRKAASGAPLNKPTPSSSNQLQEQDVNSTVPTSEASLINQQQTNNNENITNDCRLEYLKVNKVSYADFVRSLFAILYEVYGSSAGPAIKHRCLRALLRMIYYTDDSLLNDVLRNLTISSHIASMLASQDLKIIVSALQMSEILMQKLPKIFSIYFLREGVIHQIDRLIETFKPTSNNNNITINSITNMLTFTQSNQQPTGASSSLVQQQEQDSSLLNIVQPSTSSTTIQEPFSANQQPIYKLTPFGMDTIIGSSNNSEVKDSIIQPIIPSASSSIADEQIEAGGATTPKQNQALKQEMKLLETLKRKVRTPKRAGRKGTKSEAVEQSTSSAAAAANVNYETQSSANALQASSTIESTAAATSSNNLQTSSKYVQNMISKIGTNSKSQQASTSSGIVSGAASVTGAVNTSKDKSTRSSTNTTTSTQHQQPSSSSATTTAAANRSSDFSLFSGHFWSHLRNSNRNNQTTTGPTSTTTTGPTSTAATTLSNHNSTSSYKYSTSSSRRKGTSSASAAAASTGAALSNTNTNRPSTSLATSLTTNPAQATNLSTANQQIPIINYNKEKVRQWIYEQACQFKQNYFSTALLETTNKESHDLINHPGLHILKRLNKCVDKLTINLDNSSLNALKEISNIIYDTDISSFEMIHSGLITKLLDYLIVDSNNLKINRLKQFLQIFIGLPSDENIDDCDNNGKNNDNNNNSNENLNKLTLNKNNLLSNLIAKLHNCVNQLEQYTVRVQDMPSSIGYGKTAIKFFNTHQIKCLLQRHQESATAIRQWKSGPVKIDPLANISAIEKYLIMRGMNKSPQANESEDDSENSEDDIEDAMSAILGRMCESNGPRLELLINEHVLPSNMTIYQAIKQFSVHSDTDNETDTESFTTNKIWSKIHTIHYRLASQSQPQTQQQSSSSSSATTNEKRSTRKSANTINSASASTSSNQHHYHSTHTSAPSTSKSKRTSSHTTSSSTTTATAAAAQIDDHSHSVISSNQLLSNRNYMKFFDCLNNSWRSSLTIDDQSLNAISLLRILYVLNRNWHLIYMKSSNYNQLLMNYSQINTYLINTSEFVNTKLTAKANRQLQDPLVIMTGHLPKWLPEIIKTCQFLFPFETRLMFFYVNSFDRDRAMQKLLDLNSDIGHTLNDGTTSHERIVPKIDRKKKTVSRDDILKQSETILNEFGKSKALLEIQYENEVGTGLGPTLEFYALVSLEVQKVDYELWRGDKIKIQTASGTNQNSLFYYSPNGLYPAPLAKNAKQQYVNKVRSKFKFFGKFVAKAIMDFRVLDIQLSMTFYKWLVDHESLNETDLKYVDTVLYRSLDSLKEFLHKQSHLMKRRNKLIKGSPSSQNNVTSESNVQNEIELIDNELIKLDKSVKDVDLDFTLPGYNHIELKKGGKDLIVSLNNLEEYIKLVTQYTLIDGVQKQFESFIEGFNSIFPITSLQQFYPEELERLFCGSGYDIWDSKLLIECTRCDHGYTHDSKAVQFLFEIMSSYTPDEQRLFIQFVTGSPRLPVGGLRSLLPQLTIVRKTIEGSDTPDNYLPSVMTCVNYLKLPEYSNVNIMREKLNTAMTEGQLSFNLS